MPNSIEFSKSPWEEVRFRGFNIWVKRDELLSIKNRPNDDLSAAFSGNKARKLHSYLNAEYDARTIVSFGSAQSNMLYSLAALASLKKWKLEFYVDHIASYLQQNPSGNYRAAAELGASVIEIPRQYQSITYGKPSSANRIESFVENDILPNRNDVVYIPEGGRNEASEFGMQVLAEEINQWVLEKGLANPKLMLPSGTGTTALYLQKYLPFEVLTCACVGGDDYLSHQFLRLDPDSVAHPIILSAGLEWQRSKYHFGKLYPEFYKVWFELKEATGIEFELLYDPLGWLSMLSYLAEKKQETKNKLDMLYLHQGGLCGNETMLARYHRKGRPK